MFIVLTSMWFPDKWSRMYPWNSSYTYVLLKVFLQCELWLSLRSSFWVKAFPCHISFSFFSEQWAQWWSEMIPDNKVCLPTEGFPSLCIHRICHHIHLYRHLMKLESFVQTYNEARKAYIECISFSDMFLLKENEVRITKGTTTVTVFTSFISWANSLISLGHTADNRQYPDSDLLQTL